MGTETIGDERVSLSYVQFREDLMLANLATDPELYASPKQLRKDTRALLRDEGLDDHPDGVSLAFWRLLNQEAMHLDVDRKIAPGPNFEAEPWARIGQTAIYAVR